MAMYASAFWSIVAICAFLLFFYGPWQVICVDSARMVMFERRDAIFDLAMEGKLEFESEHYREIRASLERLIRFAHVSTLPYVALEFSRKRNWDNKANVNTYIERIGDQETRKIVKAHVDAAFEALIWSIGFRSLIFMIPLVIISVPYMIFSGVRKPFSHIKDRLSNIVQIEAMLGRC